MSNMDLAKRLVELLGGRENVVKATNCMTRLRVVCKDASKVDTEEIKNTEGVLGLVIDHDSYQIVLGPGKAKKITDICIQELHLPKENTDWQENKSAMKESQKNNRLKDGMKLIAEIFIPLIPAVIAAGLFNGFASLIGQMISDGMLSGDIFRMIQLIFSLFGTAFLGYFAIFTGIRSAEVFGATPPLAV